MLRCLVNRWLRVNAELLNWRLTFRKPLGNPNPQPANLALAIVLLIVMGVQAGFNAWQGELNSFVSGSGTDVTLQITRPAVWWRQSLGSFQLPSSSLGTVTLLSQVVPWIVLYLVLISLKSSCRWTRLRGYCQDHTWLQSSGWHASPRSIFRLEIRQVYLNGREQCHFSLS